MKWRGPSRRRRGLLALLLAALGPLEGSPAAAWNCSLPGLRVLEPGKYEGLKVNYLSAQTDFSSPQFVVRAQEFEACTGVRLIFADVGNVFEDPIADVGTKEADGKGLYDGYLMSYSHFPEASALGLAETLNDRIADTNERMKWEDFLPKVQVMGQFRRNNKDDIDFLMFDGDFFVPVVRIDLLEKHNLSLPHTWDDLLEQATFFHGKDLNDDGEPDFGFCHFPRKGAAGSWDWWWAELVYSTWATMAQTKDTNQGFFFDMETFEPLVDSAAFREAARIWKELWTMGEEGCVTDNVATGRCFIAYSPPGCWKGIFLNGVARKDANGTILWQPTFSSGEYAAPYRALPFGSKKVLNAQADELEDCDEMLCPLAVEIPTHGHVAGNDRASILPASPSAGELINRAPFFWSGGFGTMIRKSADPEAKDALWDYFVYINSPDTSVHDVASYSSWIDSWRRSQLTEAGENFVVDSSWSPEPYAEHRSAMWFAMGSESNAALNLRIPGIKEYTYEVVGGRMTKYVDGEITVDELVESIKSGWNEISRERGLIDQLQTYRATLGQEQLDEFRLCQLHRDVIDREDPRICRQFDSESQTLLIILCTLGAVVSVVLVSGFVVWIVWTVRSKMKLQQKEEARQVAKVEDALVSMTKLHFPMVVLDADSFFELDQFQSHETIRDGHSWHMTFLDTLEDIRNFHADNFVIFLSHQWLSYTEPDPDRTQYLCAKRAIQHISRARNWNIKRVHIWLDYFSIPQRNKVLTQTAITSLPIYAASVNVFVVLAPNAFHRETCQPCNTETYATRAWCRAEVLSHSLTNGVSTMFVTTKEELRPVNLSDDLMQEALYVFDGELSCCRLKHEGLDCCDRERLMMPFLGLFGRLHHMAEAYQLMSEKSALVQDFINTINNEKDMIFPPEIFVDGPGKRTERRLLFKGLLDRMQRRISSMGNAELLRLGFAEEVLDDSGVTVTKTVSRLSTGSSSRLIEKPVDLMLRL